jgi:phosphonate transport system substrate-binding protein
MCRPPLRFVTYLAPNMRCVYEFNTRYVGERLGIPTELNVGRSYKQIPRADIAFLCGLPYIIANESVGCDVELLAAPVLSGPRYSGRPIYFSDVIVHRDSHFRSFADLRGASWAYNEPFSHSGYGVVRYHLAELGETDGFFGHIVAAGRHERSIHLVRNGKIDASAIDSQVLAIALRDHLETARHLRVIESLGPSTIQPITAARRLPDRIKADIFSIIVEMHRYSAARTALAHGFIKRFVPIEDADYDEMRRMRAAAERCTRLSLLHKSYSTADRAADFRSAVC